MFGSSLPSLWSSATKVYSGQGADIVMQSLEIQIDLRRLPGLAVTDSLDHAQIR